MIRLLVMLAAVLLLARVSAAAALSVVTGAGTTVTASGSARCDFGSFSARPTVSHTFRLWNKSAVPLTVYNLRSSCGCTSAVMGSSAALPITVPPGRGTAVRVTLSTSELAHGFVDKTVWVEAYAPSGPVPAVSLEIVGTYGMASVPGKDGNGPAGSVGTAPTVGQRAPAFHLTDLDGHLRSLTGSSRPTALFFFCGCPWCADCARSWAKAVRSGRVPADTQTLVIFSGDASAARRFSKETSLSGQQMFFLPDTSLAVTEKLYRLNTCPRVFVVDTGGVIRYTNDHAQDTARAAPAAVIVSRTVAAFKSQAAQEHAKFGILAARP